jgi:hypothetical protein
MYHHGTKNVSSKYSTVFVVENCILYSISYCGILFRRLGFNSLRLYAITFSDVLLCIYQVVNLQDHPMSRGPLYVNICQVPTGATTVKPPHTCVDRKAPHPDNPDVESCNPMAPISPGHTYQI